jgi:transglutaminase-like putative cysteine protease
LQIAISHTTQYRFDIAPLHGLQRLRLRPKSTQGQAVVQWNMAVDGGQIQAEYDDHNHNHTALMSLNADVQEVAIHCTGLVETSDNAGIIGHHAGFMPLWAFADQTALTQPGAGMRALATGYDRHDPDRLGQLHSISAAVREAVRYEIGHTNAATTAEDALTAGHGVCQDHAHLFIGMARMIGIPARYVSGYLLMNERMDQEAGHAWAEAHVAGLGWVGFDVSNAISPDDRYVRVATGRDYRDAAPVTGVSLGAGGSELSVQLQVSQQMIAQ